MKIYPLDKLLVILFSFSVLQGCSDEEERREQLEKGNAGLLKIESVIPGMNPWTVTTRADNKDADEKQISSLQLFIFDNDGKPLLLKEGIRQLEQWYQTGTSNSFLIDKGLFSTKQPHDKAKICFLANVADNLSTISDYQSLQEYLVRFEGYVLPKSGLPMYGEQIWNLTADGNQQGEVVPITLQALVARIDVILGLESSEQDGPASPHFTLTSYDICNLPKGVKIALPGDETITADEKDYNSFRNLVPPAHAPLEDKSEPLKFHFYMGEHKALQQDGFKYPENIEENAKQRFKPKFAKKNASYLVLRGFYSDHQGIGHTVTYTIYLGANHTNDFNILRNCQYKNNITIRSITNRDTGTGISIDHRVNVTNDKFLVSIERETKLDCHIEIRPMDIQMATETGKVEVSIVDPATSNWFRMEKRSTSGAGYCSKGAHVGKRLYFTTDLVTKTLAGSTSATITSNKDNRIWLYFDENLNASTNGMREGKIRLKYYDHQNDATPSKTEEYTFKQHDLYPVTYKGRTYYIEYIEEYLYNFDPKDNFGDTTDGMPWGLKGIQVSQKEKSINISGTLADKYINSLISGVNPYYDFDNSNPPNGNKDNIAHPYNGFEYSSLILKKLDPKILKKTLEEKPASAVEYCYSKNKRNADGSIDEANRKWYLPGIDEIEDIAMGGYTTFNVFQNKYYWSSQPAYIMNRFEYSGLSTAKGHYYIDNTLNARATKVLYENGNYVTEYSGIEENHVAGKYAGAKNIAKFELAWSWTQGLIVKKTDVVANEVVIEQKGNQGRDNILRIRSVYKK